LFVETVAKILCSRGIKTYIGTDFVSTPMISLTTVTLKADLGIIITASHNPPSYNGFKLKGSYGGPLKPSLVQEIENLIPEKSNFKFDSVSIDDLIKKGIIEYVDLEGAYIEQVEKNFDLNAIRNSGLNLAYDAMY